MSRFSYTIVSDVITAVIDSGSGSSDATIPDSVTGIANNVFENNTIITDFVCTVDSLLNYMGNNVFSGCTNLTSVTLGTSQTSFGSYCFSNCTNLPTITIPLSIITMGEYAFLNCTSFTSINFNSVTITSFADGLFQNSGLIGFTVPNGVTSIGNYCFYQCSDLINITAFSLVTMGNYALAETSLSNIIFFSSVISIGSKACYNCLNLHNLDILSGPTIASDAFENTLITRLYFNPNLLLLSNIPINTSLLTAIDTDYATTSIPPNTFENLNISSITIRSVTSIGVDAFKNCTNLTSFTLDSSTTVVAAGAFNGCNSIANVSLNVGGFTSISQLQIPSSLFKILTVSGNIPTEFFQELTNLTEVTMNGSVNTISADAFKNCTALTSVSFNHNIYYGTIDITAGAFNGCNAITKVSFCPDIIPTISQLRINPSLLTNVIIINNSTIIPTSLFEGLTNLTAVSLSGDISIIDSNSFKNCSALRNISIPNSVNTLGSGAFQNCTSLTDVTIPIAITLIDSNSFNGCSSITNVTIDSFESSIGDYAFANCTTLRTVTTNNLLLFSGGETITPSFNNLSYVGPGPYTSIGDYAFYGDLSLNSFVIPASTTSIGAHAFENCISLTDITIPQDVDTIGIEAFKNCTGLTSVTLDCPGTFTDMSQNSFQNTSSIGPSSSTITNLLAKGYLSSQLIFAGFNLSGPLPCFKEDSKILCLVDGVEKEMLVQDIRNGVLVKTALNGYVPVCMIGTSKMYNPDNQTRFADRLYLCSKDKYPELNEDLVITGCHAILVDDFKEGQREQTVEKFGRVFVTDQKYRLIACFDDRATPYGVEGEFNIYHVALENENYYSNFGIYANGLLVESCSKRYLKELSNMTLL